MPLQPHRYPVGSTFGFADIPDSVMTLGYAPSEHPNIPRATSGYVFRRELLRELLGFLRDPDGDGLYLSGPTGSGKTSGVTEVLARLHWPCQQVTAHGRLEVTDLIGQFKLVSREPGEAPVMEYVYGVLPLAMKDGHVLLINELDYADPSEVAGLNDVIEGRPLVIPENGGEVIHPSPMFRLVVTGNSAGTGDESGLYQGVQAQNLAFMDRFRVSKVGYMTPAEEERILAHKVPKIPEAVRKQMVAVANAVRSQFLGESGTGADGTLAITLSTRTLVRWAKLAFDYRQHPTPLQYGMALALTHRANASEAVAIHKIAAGILGDAWAPPKVMK